MNFKNKYAVITVRILFGLFMLYSGLGGLIGGPNAQGIPEPMINSLQALWGMGIFQLIKITEIIIGLMFVINVLPAIANIVTAPITVGLLVYLGVITPAFIGGGIMVLLFNTYFTYVYWPQYKPLFKKAKL